MPSESELIAQAIANGTDLPGRTGQADTQHTYYEANGQPYFKKVGGGKMYIAPATAMSMFSDPQALAWAKAQGYEIKGGRQGLEDASKGTVGPDGKTRFPDSPVVTNSQSGGIFHTTGTWNPDSGQFDSGLDWGNILTLVVAGVMTAGVASAMMASAGVPAATADAAVSAATTTGSVEAGTAVLGGAGAASGTGGALAASTIAPTLGTLPGVAASGTIGALESAGAATAAAGAGAGVGAGETAATTGLASGAGLPGAIAAPTVGDLATTGSAIAGVDGAIPAATGASTLGTLGKIGQAAGALGSEIGGATKAAGATQLANAQVGVAANNSNISGNQAFENALMARAKLEAGQRSGALADVYRNSVTNNPSRSPFNTSAPKVQSPEYLSTLASLAAQGQKTLAAPAQYAPGSMPAQAPYTPYKPDTDPSTMQTIGNWAGPALGTIGALYKLYGG